MTGLCNAAKDKHSLMRQYIISSLPIIIWLDYPAEFRHSQFGRHRARTTFVGFAHWCPLLPSVHRPVSLLLYSCPILYFWFCFVAGRTNNRQHDLVLWPDRITTSSVTCIKEVYEHVTKFNATYCSALHRSMRKWTVAEIEPYDVTEQNWQLFLNNCFTLMRRLCDIVLWSDEAADKW